MKRIVLIHDLLSLETHGWNSWDLSPDRRHVKGILDQALCHIFRRKKAFCFQGIVQRGGPFSPVRG